MDPTTALSAREARETLTARDMEVVVLAAQGMERDGIADTLGVSRSVVNRHMTKAMRLTDTLNGTHLVATLMAQGKIRPADIKIQLEDKLRAEQAGLSKLETLAKVDRIVASYMVTAPVDETEQHTNDVLMTVARALGEQL